MPASDERDRHEIEHKRDKLAKLERLRSRTCKAFDEDRDLRLRPEHVMIIVELGILGRLEEEIAAGREKSAKEDNLRTRRLLRNGRVGSRTREGITRPV